MAFTAPASTSFDWDNITTTTLNNTREKRHDAIFRKSVILAKMNANGKRETIDGGVKLVRAVEYAVNGTIESVEGYDPVNLTPQQHLTSLEENLKEVVGSVTISRREERQNSGRAAIINLLASKIENLDRSFSQRMNEFLLAPSGTTLTAGNSGKDPLPVTEILPKDETTGTIHNISRASNTWWRHKTQVSPSKNNAAAGAVSLADHKNDLRNFYNDNTKHEGGPTDLIVCTQEWAEKYEESLEGQVRYGSTELANLGFETVYLRNAEIAWDEICPRQAANDGAYVLYNDGSAAEELAFFLNTDFLRLYVDSQSDFVNRPFMDSQDQLAKSALVVWMGQIVCTNLRTQGVYRGTDVSAIG
jgi:hypothetical protein